MKELKKLLCTLLAVMVLFAFAACEKNSNDKGENNEPNTEDVENGDEDLDSGSSEDENGGKKVSSKADAAKTEKPEETEEPEETADAPDETGEGGTYTLGDTFQFNGLEITFGDNYEFTTDPDKYSDLYGTDVIAIPIKVKNISKETNNLSSYDYKSFGSKGTELDYSVAWDFETPVYDKMRSGAELEGYIYMLYDGDGEYCLEFDPNDYKADNIEVLIDVAKQ